MNAASTNIVRRPVLSVPEYRRQRAAVFREREAEWRRAGWLRRLWLWHRIERETRRRLTGQGPSAV